MNDTILKAFTTRAAIKVFDATKPVAEKDITTILESARMSPTAYGLQPFKIVHVTNPALRTELVGAAYGQEQVGAAPHLFIIAARTDIDAVFINSFVELVASVRGMKVEDLKQYNDMMVNDITSRTPEGRFAWAGRQAYIALGAMIETAALLGVDAGPMEGFDVTKVDQILGLKEHNLTALALLAIGYRGDDSYSKMPKVRLSMESLVITI